MTEAEILADFPDLELEDIRAALAFAAERERRLVSIPPRVKLLFDENVAPRLVAGLSDVVSGVRPRSRCRTGPSDRRRDLALRPGPRSHHCLEGLGLPSGELPPRSASEGHLDPPGQLHHGRHRGFTAIQPNRDSRVRGGGGGSVLGAFVGDGRLRSDPRTFSSTTRADNTAPRDMF